MLSYGQAVGDADVARRMRKVFRLLPSGVRRDPVRVAEIYGNKLFDVQLRRVRDEASFVRSSFSVGLTIDSGKFEDLTKRTILISDTLLLSHGWTAPYCEVGEYNPTEWGVLLAAANEARTRQYTLPREDNGNWRHRQVNYTALSYGMHCPDLAALGTWLLQAESLLKAGLAWYLPSYSTRGQQMVQGVRQPPQAVEQVAAVDYIIRHGRLIDPSESNPVKDRLIRPVLEIDLPFIEGVTLKDFSKITTGEFDSYRGFRNFLRSSFLSMDQALNGEQTQIELTKLRLEIEDQVQAMRAEFLAARRKRVWAVTGAVAASTAALLIAVNGSVLERVLTTLGFTTAGTFWGAITARVENSPHVIKSGKWYYVWILSKKSSAL
ncbi:hypothetical protein [Streptomyces iranensis]|uniref:Uncharacterized protein n=2 Tax=Streptomyces iranensis TaxID=576784 RepID=A0ABS4MWA2_9ACTN|nr:hypothetical protein [Streptomyces iranensis]MBP2063733.1 hypothetical protein [Streptomyces iranensis]